MNKPFITYTAQVDKLQNEKNLIITDTNFAITSLKNISYFGLVDGYKLVAKKTIGLPMG